MQVRAFGSAQEFATLAGPYLEEHPAETTVLATVLADVLSGARSYRGATWLCAEDGGAVVGVGMNTPPHRLWLSPMPDRAAEGMAAEMARRMPPGALPGIAGEERAAGIAAEAWNRLRPTEQITSVRRIRLYVLDALRGPQDVPGAARPAIPGDLDLLSAWWEAFCVEADVLSTPPREAIQPRLEGHGALFMWLVDDTPVAMAGHTVAAAGVTRVGPVYTVPEQRRRGYGAAVTTVATQHALDAGSRQVVLFTDLGNPVSNSIYQQIGYRPVRDYVEMDLVEPG